MTATTAAPPAHEHIGDRPLRSVASASRTALHALLLRPGAILSRAELEERIYGWNEEVESNAVEFLIHGIRKKLGQAAIKNVRGVGWMVDREMQQPSVALRP